MDVTPQDVKIQFTFKSPSCPACGLLAACQLPGLSSRALGPGEHLLMRRRKGAVQPGEAVPSGPSPLPPQPFPQRTALRPHSHMHGRRPHTVHRSAAPRAACVPATRVLSLRVPRCPMWVQLLQLAQSCTG